MRRTQYTPGFIAVSGMLVGLNACAGHRRSCRHGTLAALDPGMRTSRAPWTRRGCTACAVCVVCVQRWARELHAQALAEQSWFVLACAGI